MRITIKSWTGRIIHETEAETLKAAVESADLRGANLSYADLSGANLSYADLRGAHLSYAVIPKIEKLDTAVLAAINGGGILEMGSWHVCETTHCRAGWYVHLAGEAGKKLETKLGTSTAAALIFCASKPGERVPDFYADNETALADIKASAAKEDK